MEYRRKPPMLTTSQQPILGTYLVTRTRGQKGKRIERELVLVAGQYRYTLQQMATKKKHSFYYVCQLLL